MQQNQPSVFIILVTWNGKDDTLACLNSLQEVDYPSFQIILIDNASTDGVVKAVGQHYPNVTTIQNKDNRRFAGANNQGIQIAMEQGADYILLLNNDTEVKPDFLKRLIDCAQSEPQAGITGGKIYHFDQPDKIWYAGGIVNLARGNIAHIGIRERDENQFNLRCDTGYVTGCCLLMSRACVEKTGLLDESYFIYAEDADFCQRARLAGFRLLFEPKAHIWHKVSSSSGGKNVPGGLTWYKIYHKTRSTLTFLWRYARWYNWLTIPFFWTGYALKAISYIVISRLKAASSERITLQDSNKNAA